MKVTCHYKSDGQPLVCAYPKVSGVLIRFCSGDVCDPYGGYWFKEPYHSFIIRFVMRVWQSALWVLTWAVIWSFGITALVGYSWWFLLLLIPAIIAFLITPGLYFAWYWPNGWGGYIGWQIYGVDSEQYKNFLPAEDVYDGSQAMSFTARLTTKVD